jgi:hypothetical protein
MVKTACNPLPDDSPPNHQYSLSTGIVVSCDSCIGKDNARIGPSSCRLAQRESASFIPVYCHWNNPFGNGSRSLDRLHKNNYAYCVTFV